MIPERMRRIQASPAKQLRSPGDIGVLAIDEEIRIEELALNADVVDHLAAIERGGRRRAEHILVNPVMPVIDFLAAAVQVAHHRREVDSRGIDQRLLGQFHGRLNRQQLAANRADPRVHLAGIDQRLDEIRQQQNVGIERKNPRTFRQIDRLVLGGGKTDVFGL